MITSSKNNNNSIDSDCEDIFNSELDEIDTVSSDTKKETLKSKVGEINSVPTVLEILDFATQTYRVSPVALKRAPIMMCFVKHNTAPVVLDTGAENNVIGDVTCRKLGLTILKTCSQAQQVDKSPLKSIGRVLIQFENGAEAWTFDGLVCSGIGDIIIAGNPFLEQGINPVTYKNLIEIVTKDGFIRTLPWRPVEPLVPIKPKVFLLKVEEKVTIYPEEYIELKVPIPAKNLESSEVMITPRHSSNVRMVNCLPTTHLAMEPKPVEVVSGGRRYRDFSRFCIHFHYPPCSRQHHQ